MNNSWKDLYRAAAVAAVISEVVILLGVVLFFVWPYAPGVKSTEEIFIMLQNHPLGGLISLDLFLLLGNLFSLFLFLSFYIITRPVNRSYALIALALGLVGLILLIPARPLPEMLHLSRAYAGATAEAAKNQLLAAGDAVLASFDGIGWFLNTLLGGLSLLLSSILMLRSPLVGKATAVVGIVSNAAVCLFFLPVVGTIVLFVSMIGYLVWYFLLTRDFIRLGWKRPDPEGIT
jgi:hypothetical protein